MPLTHGRKHGSNCFIWPWSDYCMFIYYTKDSVKYESSEIAGITIFGESKRGTIKWLFLPGTVYNGEGRRKFGKTMRRRLTQVHKHREYSVCCSYCRMVSVHHIWACVLIMPRSQKVMDYMILPRITSTKLAGHGGSAWGAWNIVVGITVAFVTVSLIVVIISHDSLWIRQKFHETRLSRGTHCDVKYE